MTQTYSKKHSSISSSQTTDISKAPSGKRLPVFFEFCVDDDGRGHRLDVFLAEQDDPPLSRSQVRKAIDSGDIHVNGVVCKAGYTLREGDLVEWLWTPVVESSLEAEAIPLEFLYEDDHLAVVNKPAGMVVHPAPGHSSGTLVNALLHHFTSLPGMGGVLRPGIVHRLDKDTSGALAVTKSDVAHQHLSKLLKDHDITREYHALVFAPKLADKATIRTLYGRHPKDRIRFSSLLTQGKEAVTHFEVLERFDHHAALVVCRLETGRTHQIRVHLSDLGAPLLGDSLYGGKATAHCRIIQRQALHARTLGFVHLDGAQVMCNAPYPADFEQALNDLRRGKDWR